MMIASFFIRIQLTSVNNASVSNLVKAIMNELHSIYVIVQYIYSSVEEQINRMW